MYYLLGINVLISLVITTLYCFWMNNYHNVFMNLSMFNHDFQLKLSLVGIYSFILGFIICMLFFSGIIFVKLSKVKTYKNKLEEKSVDKDKDQAKIEALERKIATLEKALVSKISK